MKVKLLLLQISLNLAGLSNSASLCGSSVGWCDTLPASFIRLLMFALLVATDARKLESGWSISVDCIMASSLTIIAEISFFLAKFIFFCSSNDVWIDFLMYCLSSATILARLLKMDSVLPNFASVAFCSLFSDTAIASMAVSICW